MYLTLVTFIALAASLSAALPYSLNNTTSFILTIPTFSPSVTNNTVTGACGPGIGPCAPGLCCSGYGYCGHNSSYCGTNCMPRFGVCGLNSSHSNPVPAAAFSYAPLNSSTSVTDNTGAAGIVTDVVETAYSVPFSYAPASSSVVGFLAATLTGIEFDPTTALESTAAVTGTDFATMTTTVTVEETGCGDVYTTAA